MKERKKERKLHEQAFRVHPYNWITGVLTVYQALTPTLTVNTSF